MAKCSYQANEIDSCGAMETVTLLYPLATLLLLPLLVAVLLSVVRWIFVGRPTALRGRLAWSALGYTVGLAVTAIVLVFVVLRPDHCRAQSQGTLNEADSFVVFSFGLGPDAEGKSTAGASNHALAKWVLANNPTRKPTIVQEGVYLALKESNTAGSWVIRLSDRPGVYVDTMGGAYQAETLLHLRKLKRPVIVAHDLQLQRAVWSMEAVGVSDYVVPEMPPTPFDPSSVQHSGTRDEFVWVVRELLFARPVTLRPQMTIVLVGVIAFLYGLALRLI
jgi:hypothetical protein